MEKLPEEFKEFIEAQNQEEFADIQEVLRAIAEYKHFDLQEIEEIRKRKLEERGGFKERIILDES